MSKAPVPHIKVECRNCFGDGWVGPGLSSNRTYKITCKPCEGKGYKWISPFEFDPKRDTKVR